MITVKLEDSPTLVCDDDSKFKFKLDETNQKVICLLNNKEIGKVADIYSNSNYTDEEFVKRFLDIGQDII